MTDAVDALAEQETALVLDSFDHDDAWLLGSRVRERAAAAALGVAIDIRRPSGAVLFHAALPGATADNDRWIERKSAVVFRFECSSALVAARLGAAGVDAEDLAWLDATAYAVTGGSLPIRVRGAGIVAALTVSGLSSDDDHALAATCVAQLRDERRSARA
ncbi:heme-degrading domain-containing protein [Microbacterium sp. NPDC091313]